MLNKLLHGHVSFNMSIIVFLFLKQIIQMVGLASLYELENLEQNLKIFLCV